MKGVIFFSFSKFWKGVFVKKKKKKKKILKKIKAVLRETELKNEFPIYFRQNEKEEIIKWNVTRESELILDQFFKKITLTEASNL